MATPVIIGVGDIVNRSVELKDAREPRRLMLEAIQKAIQDTEARSNRELQKRIDSIDVVACWTWPYEDLPGLLAKDLDIKPVHKFIPKSHGGNQPAKFLDQAAKRIVSGQAEVAVICGGEALASLTAFAKAKQLPPPGWTRPEKNIESVFSPTTRDLYEGLGKPHSIGAPIQVYPLYENGLRAERGQSIEDNTQESGELYASFAQAAEKQAYAWNYGKKAEDAQSITTVSKKNRMICFPYPLLMNAFNTVNLAAACIITSTDLARKLGVPETKWIYPLGGAGTQDSSNFWERPNYHSSPAISQSLDIALRCSNLTKDDIDVYDFYSCFPIVPKVACRHLGLSITQPEKPITLLGGLTSFGGAGNNYSMHAITEMSRQLRQGKARTGLVLANGGVMTYQHVVVLSNRPRKDGSAYPTGDHLPEFLESSDIPEIEVEPNGDAIIETYTVDFGRDGKPVNGHVVGRLKSNGHRFLANHGDGSTLQQLCSSTREPVGRNGYVTKDPNAKGRNLFTFKDNSKL